MLKKFSVYFIFLFLFLSVSPNYSVAGVITITDDFSTDPSTNWTLNGDASWNGLRITLTPALSYQAGSIWYNTGYDLSKYSNLKAEFDAYLGYVDYGADGITFAIIDTSNGLNALGGDGGALGYGGIPGNSLAIELDTYSNPSEPSSDHIGIDLNGSTASLITAAVPNLEDNTWHHVEVDFDISQKTISVYLDGVLCIDNYTVTGFTPFNAYFGFTGGTGYYKNLQQIDNVNITLTPVPLPGTFWLFGGGLVGGLILRRKIKKNA